MPAPEARYSLAQGGSPGKPISKINEPWRGGILAKYVLRIVSNAIVLQQGCKLLLEIPSFMMLVLMVNVILHDRQL